MQKEISYDVFSPKNLHIFLFKLPDFFRAPGVIYLAFLFKIILDIFPYLFYYYALWGLKKKKNGTVERRICFAVVKN